jgi:hypothetical protein
MPEREREHERGQALRILAKESGICGVLVAL